MPRRKASSGKTAMAHARAWAELKYPESLLVEAQPKLMRVPDGRGGIRTLTREEDIWGVFDMLVFPTRFAAESTDRKVHLVQVTTADPTSANPYSAASARRKKVAKWVRDTLWAGRPEWLGDILVIAWVPRKHFRVWWWSLSDAMWLEQDVALAPLPRAPRKTPQPPAS